MKITIPNPCSEDWQTMTATEKGQFCAVCQKCVVDFTTMTDAEIIRYLDGQKDKTCGRFTKEQLNRPLTPPNRFKILFAKWVLASTFSLSFMSPKEGFTAVPMVRMQQTLANAQMKEPSLIVENPSFTDSLVIKGVVLDSANKELLVGASIVIEGTSIGTLTDVDGNFVLNIPIEYQNKDINLTASFSGYDNQGIFIQFQNINNKHEIKLKPAKIDKLIVIAGELAYRPLTFKSRIKRLFRKRKS